MKTRIAQFRLTAQLAFCSVMLVLVCAALLALFVGWRTQSTQNVGLAWGTFAVGAGLAVLAGVLGVLVARPRSDDFSEMTQAAERIRRGETDASLATLPPLEFHSEAKAMSLSLRRMVESLRQQIATLESQNASLQQSVAARTREVTSLTELSKNLSDKSDMQSLLNATLAALEQTLDYSSASIWGREDGSVVLLSYRSDQPAPVDISGLRLSDENSRTFESVENDRKPMVVNQVRRSVLSWLWAQITDDATTSNIYRSTRSWMAVPLQSQKKVAGVLRVDHENPNYFNPERERLLNAIGSQAGLAMHHAQLQEQARQYAVVLERNRIARELHDAVSQTLFAANVIAGTLPKTLGSDPTSLPLHLAELQRLNKGALAEMRLLMYELRPDAMEQADLGELLRHTTDAIVSRTGIRATVRTDNATQLPPLVKFHLYRIAQEALGNMVRHSKATEVDVELQVPAPTRCYMRIADNGEGFDATRDKPGHFGLGNMRDRSAEIGAELNIQSEAGKGTELTVVWHPEAIMEDQQ